MQVRAYAGMVMLGRWMLWQFTCAGSSNQTWTFTASSAAAGKFLIKSVGTGLCVSD
jgi:pectate lyase